LIGPGFSLPRANARLDEFSSKRARAKDERSSSDAFLDPPDFGGATGEAMIKAVNHHFRYLSNF